MAALFHPGADPSRIYYGTDTRLFDLMAGATIAFLAAARRQPEERARRIFHWVGPAGGGGPRGVLGDRRDARRPALQLHVRGRVPALCGTRRARRVRRTRLVEPGTFARGLAWRPLHFVGTISYGVYLWHWPVIVYLTAARTGLSTWPLNLLRIAVTLAISTASYYLVERPIRLARFRGGVRIWGPLAGVVTAVVIVVATIPAVADPTNVVGTSRLATASTGSGDGVPGAGGYQGQQPIRLTAAPSPADPLRVLLLGDSVIHDASFGITAALQATGAATVDTHTVLGFGLTTSLNWPTVIPNLVSQTQAQLIVGSWSWDQFGPTTPNALHQPVQYTKLLRRAVSTMLTPGNGVEGVIFTEFPQPGNVAPTSQARAISEKERRAGVTAWNAIAAKMPSYFPGRVMYFPLGSSLLVDGKYSAWLPPQGDPHAPSSDWLRARKLDNVHLCPEGAARYANALLADMTALSLLPPAEGNWAQGAWTTDPDYNDPPGTCPDDHPPG